MTCDDLANLHDACDLTAVAREHLAACPACRERAGALTLARTALLAAADGPPPPEGLRDRLVAAAKAPPPSVPVQDAPATNPLVRVRLRCTFCHDPLASASAVFCADCLAPVHRGCFEEHGRCPAPMCGGRRLVEPRPVRSPRLRRGLAALAAAALGLGVAAWSQQRAGAPALVTTERTLPAAPASSSPPGPASDDAPPEAAPVDSQQGDPAANRLRVLVVEGDNRFEFRYLKTILLRDRRLAVQTLLLSQDETYLNEVSPGLRPLNRMPPLRELRGYDVIVLGDVLAYQRELGDEALRDVADAIHDGTGLLVIDGAGSARRWAGTPLGSLLPVRFEEKGLAADPAAKFQPRRAMETDVLQLEDAPRDDEAVWQALPPVRGYVLTQRPAADADVYLEHPDTGKPLLAYRLAQRGRCFWLGFETRHWREYSGDRHMARFYGKLLRAAGNVLADDLARPGDEFVLRRDGQRLQVRTLSIREAGGPQAHHVVSTTNGTFPLAEVEEVHLSAYQPTPVGPALVLRGPEWAGKVSVLRGDVATRGDGHVSLDSPALGRVSVPFDAVRALLLGESVDAGELTALAFARPDPHVDVVRLRGAGEVRGELVGIDRGAVYIRSADLRRDEELDVRRVQRIDLAAPADGRPPAASFPVVEVFLDDGSRLVTGLVELSPNTLVLSHPGVGQLPPIARARVLTILAR